MLSRDNRRLCAFLQESIHLLAAKCIERVVNSEIMSKLGDKQDEIYAANFRSFRDSCEPAKRNAHTQDQQIKYLTPENTEEHRGEEGRGGSCGWERTTTIVD